MKISLKVFLCVCDIQAGTIRQLYEAVARIKNAEMDSFYLTYGGKMLTTKKVQ